MIDTFLEVSLQRNKDFESKLYIFFFNFADRASPYIHLNINQLDALNFIMSLFHASTCFEHMCSSSGGLILCTGRPPIGVMIPEAVEYNFDLLTMST